jgi:tol-pal system protein YbgF
MSSDMKKRLFPILLAVGCLGLFSVPPASAGTKEQLIQLQTTVQMLQDNMARMQQSFDERMGVVKDLITQQTDNVNRMNTAIDTLQKTLQQQTVDSSKTVDQVSGQVQALHDSVDEVKALLAKVSKRLDDVQTTLQNVPNPAVPGPTGTPGTVTPGTTPGSAANQAPPPNTLYDNALGDFNGGKNDLAAQEFTQFLQVYNNNDLAGNAQFYLGEIDYRRNNFQAAVDDYNKVLDQYPGGNKGAAAQLKKGFALLELGQKDAGVKELRSLLTRYPKSPEAAQAKDRLNKLGVAGAASSSRPSPRHQ